MDFTRLTAALSNPIFTTCFGVFSLVLAASGKTSMKLAYLLLALGWAIGAHGFYNTRHNAALFIFTIASVLCAFWIRPKARGPDIMLAYDSGLFGRLLVKNTNGATAYNVKIMDIKHGKFRAMFNPIPMLCEGLIVPPDSSNNQGTIKALRDAIDIQYRSEGISSIVSIPVLIRCNTATGRCRYKFILEYAPFHRSTVFRFVGAKWNLRDYLYAVKSASIPKSRVS